MILRVHKILWFYLENESYLEKLSFYIFGLILHERNHRFSACIIIFHTSSIHARGNCSRKWEKCMEVRVEGWFSALCPVWESWGERVFVHAFALSLKEMVKISFSYERGNFDVTLKDRMQRISWNFFFFFYRQFRIGKDRRKYRRYAKIHREIQIESVKKIDLSRGITFWKIVQRELDKWKRKFLRDM